MFLKIKTDRALISASYAGEAKDVKITYDDSTDELRLEGFDCMGLNGVKIMYRPGEPFSLKSIVFVRCKNIQWSTQAFLVANHFNLPEEVKMDFVDCEGDEEMARLERERAKYL